MTCVDGFVIAVPKRKLRICARVAKLGAKPWMQEMEQAGATLRMPSETVRAVCGGLTAIVET